MIEAVKVGLHSKLRRLDLSEAWIERREDDLVGQGLAEYARARSRGTEIANPGGWLVHTGYRRAIDQLRREGHEIYGEGAEAIIDSAADPSASTDAEALEHVQSEQLNEAIASLSVSERQALSLYFFEEMSTRSAAEALGLSEPTFRRRRDSALQSLRERLGIEPEQGDALAVEVGLAAWLSLAAAGHSALLVDRLLAVPEGIRGAVGAPLRWIRETTVRLFTSGGGEGVSGVVGSAGGRAAGVCATGLVACVATGVVGPGLGGVDLVNRGGPAQSAQGRPAPVQQNHRAPAPPRTPSAGEQQGEGRNASGASKNAGGGGEAASSRRERRSERKASSQFGVESEAAPEETPPEPEPSPSSGSGGGEESAPSATRSANEQFGLP